MAQHSPSTASDLRAAQTAKMEQPMTGSAQIKAQATRVKTPREALAVLGAAADVIAGQQADVTSQIAEIATARTDAGNAEAALRNLLFEETVSGAPDPQQKERLAATIRTARAKIGRLQELEVEKKRLQAEFEANAQARKAKVLKVVEAEAAELARTYHRHARIALASEAALKGLANWALHVEGATGLGVAIRSLTLPGGSDQTEGAKVSARLKAQLEDLANTWSALPTELLRSNGRSPVPSIDLDDISSPGAAA